MRAGRRCARGRGRRGGARRGPGAAKPGDGDPPAAGGARRARTGFIGSRGSGARRCPRCARVSRRVSLRELSLTRRYRGREGDMLAALYLPCLSESVRYSRAVGYFSASALSLAARGLGPFVKRGGEMRLIASPDLTGVDPELVNEALAER